MKGREAFIERYAALPEGPSLRARRIPDERVSWYDAEQQAWIAVAANADPGEALKIAQSIYG